MIDAGSLRLFRHPRQIGTAQSTRGVRSGNLHKSQFHFLIARSLSDEPGNLRSNRTSKSDRLLASGNQSFVRKRIRKRTLSLLSISTN